MGGKGILDRLDRIPCELDPLLPTEQIQQDEDPLCEHKSAEQTNLILQRAAKPSLAHQVEPAASVAPAPIVCGSKSARD
jgi:hypothetical protein